MSPTYILGIDSGLTVTKAVIFDAAGRLIAVGRSEVPTLKPRARFVERDMQVHWECCAGAIREALAKANITAGEIAAVGLTGHGDGVYLLDAQHAPLGPAVLSLDSRAASVLQAWREQGDVMDEALRLTGQQPYVAAPAAVLRWLRDHEPERYARIRWVLSCKDWLRFCLTGQIATDLTEASQSFCDPRTQDYSSDALALYGLQAMRESLAPMLEPCQPAGQVSVQAAALTGLRAGTPVAAGMHDVVASAVGSGVMDTDVLSLVAGTYSINQVFSATPHAGRDWFCRNGFERGQWINMSISPASSANIDWYLKQHCRDAIEHASGHGRTPFYELDAELDDAFASDSTVIFHPFLYGSPHSDEASASFLGVQGWHHRGHLLRALLEGVVFNHRHHVDALRTTFRFDRARLTGGSSRNPRVCQLFSDVLGLDIEVVDVEETGALAAALCGAVSVGLYDDLRSATAVSIQVAARYATRPDSHAEADRRYARYQQTVLHMNSLWSRLRGDLV